mmetsp:Transcript_21717/g.39866  ORF Transcript_21717/g.39866 Transcript_21717/m.39866 type:complete len:320 (-) Transcript_21717:88-1047(-)
MNLKLHAAGAVGSPAGSPVGSPKAREILERIREIMPADLSLEGKIGSGATSEVYKGVWEGRTVAVKELVIGDSHRLRDQVAFAREVAAITRLSHPNLVTCFGVVLAEKPLRIVTAYCAGGTCLDWLQSDEYEVPISWPQRLKAALDVAHGVNYLHTCKPQIIHRDLKSGNLLLKAPVRSVQDVPHVCISDFGFSRMNTLADWSEMKLTCVGTFRWMAPEVLSGSYDIKVDVYSFAMVLFEILSRELPFETVEDDQVRELARQGGRPDHEAIRPDCPESLIALMEDCWCHDPDERPMFENIVARLDAVQPPEPAWELDGG